MKYIKNEQLNFKRNPFTDTLFTEDCIFFDIETTGFSPVSSSVYLIGCLHRKGNHLILEQFFAENKSEEQEIITRFMGLLKRYKSIISFNGIGFDIPFLNAKCNSYGIKNQLLEVQFIDIFKLISNMKFLLKLPNYKQKTIESFLDLQREDIFSGGELINIYDDYVRTKSPEAEHLLLLHNFEDVTGMLDLLPILTYHHILNGSYSIRNVEIASFTPYENLTNQENKRKEMIITLSNDYVVPKRVSFHYGAFYFTLNKDITKIRIETFEGELKYFHKNYKDYFYLPEEDMAIHQSVAAFVDKKYRERAKACNCYTRKNGIFLPQYTEIMKPSFKENYKDKITYFELTEDFKTSDIMLCRYVEHIFQNAQKTISKDKAQ